MDTTPNVLTKDEVFSMQDMEFRVKCLSIRLYENIICKFNITEGWSKEINCNIGVKQGCPLSPTLFGMYIDKLEECLEKEGCVGPTCKNMMDCVRLTIENITIVTQP